MPSDIEGQRKQRTAEIAACATKKKREADRRAQKQKEKQALKEAEKLVAQAARQAKKNTRTRKAGTAAEVLHSANEGEPRHEYQ